MFLKSHLNLLDMPYGKIVAAIALFRGIPEDLN
jgi:hypothetical protein